jgi:hypothetical protein
MESLVRDEITAFGFVFGAPCGCAGYGTVIEIGNGKSGRV